MTPDQQQTYLDFITVAACELSVEGIDVEQFLTVEGEELVAFTDAVTEMLDYANRTVRALV